MITTFVKYNEGVTDIHTIPDYRYNNIPDKNRDTFLTYGF